MSKSLSEDRSSEGKMYDVLLKRGEIIDPSERIHAVGSVAILDGKIAEIAVEPSNLKANTVFQMDGKIITPGLIDLHCHPVGAFAWLGVDADTVGLNNAVTLLCDAGTSGAANFGAVRRFILEDVKTDLLCFLNISNTGLITMPELRDQSDIDFGCSVKVIEANRDFIRGVKIRAVEALADGVGIKAIELAKQLANRFKIPLMMHLGETRDRVPGDKMDTFSRTAVSMLEEGDILSHYLTWESGGMVLRDGTVYSELEAARQRGVILDACNGLNHFSFSVARHALAKGLVPTVISTDIASPNVHITQSLPVVMSKFLKLGLSIDQVIEMTTINAAKALGEEAKRGSLKPGLSADIAVFELVRGDFVFSDGQGGEILTGDVLLEPRMVFKAGEAMPAFSAYHVPRLP